MNFLEFAVWGAYLTCMGNYLGKAGLGEQIAWFYAIQGIVSIFMPTLMGIVADKYIQPQRLLGICHLLAGGFMLGCWMMGVQAGFGNELANKGLFIALYTLSVAFFMPTIALANTTAFTILKERGMDTVKDFPPIRVLGTIGFIATMWIVNCAVWENGSFSFTFDDNAPSQVSDVVPAFDKYGYKNIKTPEALEEPALRKASRQGGQRPEKVKPCAARRGSSETAG